MLDISLKSKLLSEAQLNELLLRVQTRFSWPSPAERYELLSVNKIRTGSLYRCRALGEFQHDIAVKVGKRWKPEDARDLYARMTHISEFWPTSYGLSFVSALGWDPEPPCICMPFIQGQNLQNVLKSGIKEGSASNCFLFVSRCGASLGAFHSRLVPTAELAGRALLEAEMSLQKAARRMLASTRLVRRISAGITVSRTYVDFGPHNILVDPQGHLYLIDAPALDSFAPVHKDVAAYLAALELIRTAERSRSARIKQHVEELGEAFVHGYAETGPEDIRTPGNRWLTTLYEGYKSSNIAYNWWRRGDRKQALSHFALWLRALLRIRISPTNPILRRTMRRRSGQKD
jgi:hypothetical protein